MSLDRRCFAETRSVGDFMHTRTLWLRGQGRGVQDDPWIRWAYGYVESVRDPRNGHRE
jgi:hypothetical protein